MLQNSPFRCFDDVPEYEDWELKLKDYILLSEHEWFTVGDLLVDGENIFGEEYSQGLARIKEQRVLEKFKKYKLMATVFPPEVRYARLSVSYYKELLYGFKNHEDERIPLLSRAANEKLTIEQVREEKRIIQGKSPKKEEKESNGKMLEVECPYCKEVFDVEIG